MELKEITKDWNQEFSALKRYTERKLYILYKPVIIGLRIETNHDWAGKPEYSVMFEIIPLWENNDKNPNALSDPFISDEVKRDGAGKRRYPQPIRFRDHKALLEHVIECTKDEFGCFLGESIVFEKIISFVFKRFIKPVIKYHTWPCVSQQYNLLIGLALYYSNDKLIKFIKEQIERESKQWSKDNRQYCKNKLISNFGDKEKFFARIEENCKRPKVAKLNVGQFVGIEDFEPPKTFWDKVRSIFHAREQK